MIEILACRMKSKWNSDCTIAERPLFQMSAYNQFYQKLFPNPVYKEESFEIVAVEPQKTLLEKLFLLTLKKFSSMEPDSFHR